MWHSTATASDGAQFDSLHAISRTVLFRMPVAAGRFLVRMFAVGRVRTLGDMDEAII